MNEQQLILIQRLKEGDLNLNRFLKINDKKSAIEEEWQNRLYSPEDLDSFPRWGICGKNRLVLIDCDKREIYDLLSKTLPQTFEVTSPRRGLPHKYFIVSGGQIQNKTLHIPNDKEGAGEIRADNQYLVAPGTEITYKDLETGEQKTGIYTVTKNIPIALMEYNEFMQAVKPYLGKNVNQPITFEEMRKGVPKGTRHPQGIKYATFLVGVQKFDFATALAEMLRWNQLCQPPMDEADLKRMVENALGYVDATSSQEKLTNATLEELKTTYKKWLYLERDDEVLDILLATAIDRVIPGDPIWLFLISPSGGTKTELVRSLVDESRFYSLDSLTTHTLVSGKVEPDENGDLKPVKGILPQINGKTLIIKDFTNLLAKRQEDRDEIFSQLRCLYDGYLEYGFGTLPSPIRIKADIGLIAAVTPAVDQYSRLYIQLGERFLKLRHHPDSEKATKQALKNLGLERAMRDELISITKRFFLTPLKPVAPIKDEYFKNILEMAQATAVLRTPVTLKVWKFEVNEALSPAIEYPTRLSKQLLKLAICLATVRGKTEIMENEIVTVRRVAKDTIYPNRLKIIEVMEEQKSYTTRAVAELTKIPVMSCWRELMEMQYLGIVEYEESECELRNYNGDIVKTKHTPDKDGWVMLQPSLKKAFFPNLVSTNPTGTDNEINNSDDKGGKTSPVLVDTEPAVPNLYESDVGLYKQLWCYICNTPITDDHWTLDDFTENKPAHKKCYDDHRAQLKEDS